LSYDDAIRALSNDALRFVSDGQVLGLGSGRAAAEFVRSLGRQIREKKLNVRGVPTSLQIKVTAEESGVPLLEADQIGGVDVVFDGADQIDAAGYLVKGGGGALLRENILISSARKVVIMADRTKFVKRINRSVPVEVSPHARRTAAAAIGRIGGRPSVRTLDSGYPFFTEGGNIILDCDFGVIDDPRRLSHRIIRIAGVMEAGLFTRRPDVIYKAKAGGRFEVIG